MGADSGVNYYYAVWERENLGVVKINLDAIPSRTPTLPAWPTLRSWRWDRSSAGTSAAPSGEGLSSAPR